MEIMPVFLRSLLALMLLALSALAFPAVAQGPSSNGSAIVREQQAVLEGLRQRTDQLEKTLDANSEDDARLVDTRLQLEEAARQLLQASVAFGPRLTEINGRLEQLGAAPAEGQPPEPELVARERQALLAEKAEINAALGVAEDESIRINSLITRITEMRRDLFSRLLTRRYDIDTALVGEVAHAARNEATDLYRTVSSWLRYVVQFKLRSVLFATFFALLAAAILLIGGRRLFGRVFEADSDVESPSYLSRLSVAFWSTLIPTAALAGFLTTTYLLYDYFAVLTDDIGTMMTSLFIVIGLVFFVYRLGVAVLSPNLPNWRLIAVDTGAARLLLWLVSATAIFTGIDVFLRTVYSVLDSPLSLTVAEAEEGAAILESALRRTP